MKKWSPRYGEVNVKLGGGPIARCWSTSFGAAPTQRHDVKSFTYMVKDGGGGCFLVWCYAE